MEKAYFVPPLGWTGPCSLGYVTLDMSIARDNFLFPYPGYQLFHLQNGSIPLLSPLGIAITSLTGIAGENISGIALSLKRELSKETARAIKETALALAQIQEQLDFLAIILQNQRSLDFLTAGQGETCIYLQEEWCFCQLNRTDFHIYPKHP